VSDAAASDRLDRLARASSLAMRGIEYVDVAPAIEDRMRSLCLAFPEVVERPAWAGTQWRIRNRMFAHVIAVDFADGPVTVLIFRSSGQELNALRGSGEPFFRPAWGVDAVGMVIEPGADWQEISELVTDSYCTVAPNKLVARVERPGS
jgi:YjbR